jgi:uncharacterized cupredoxin-like copper-binding protein
MKTALLLSISTLALSGFALSAQADDMHMHHAGKAQARAVKADRTIAIDMNDNMRFTPTDLSAKQGETIRFIVKNSGRVKHEMVIGSIDELKAHAEMMRKMPGMVHAESNQVGVEPGKTGEIVWQFAKAGAIDFACLEPGHFEAGMKGKIAVAAKERS